MSPHAKGGVVTFATTDLRFTPRLHPDGMKTMFTATALIAAAAVVLMLTPVLVVLAELS